MNNQIDIQEELGKNFLVYALDTDQNKAFPSVADGLAPGARAALWEMYNSKYFSTKPHVKSAKVAAGVIGRWWPHNADATYGTLVRMAQPFIENCLEIDFQGAVGNQIIGQDSAGSSRYTEMRLSKLAEEGMFRGINKDNVDMIWNYLQDEKWPKVLPSVFPRLLVNGSIGLGVGLSQYWTLHSFSETAQVIEKYLEDGTVDNDNYYPDFPTGGVIVNKDELGVINKTGKGRIIVQAQYKINDNQIIFYEFPYQVFIEPVITKIKTAYNDGKLTALEDVYNSSDKTQISITVTVANGFTPEQCINQLFAYTPLQSTYHVNQNAIINQAPEMVTLEKYLDVYVKHNLECIRREHKFDLKKTQERIEILEGLLKALAHIDDVVKAIRNSKDKAAAKSNLIEKFDLTSNQADAILKMQLSRLANLEQVAIEDELQEKKEFATFCAAVVESEDKQKEILIERLRELVRKYGDTRRTQVIQKEIAKVAGTKKAKEKIIEDVVIGLTQNRYIKSVPVNAFRSNNTYLKTFKARTDELFLLFSSLGKMYRLKVEEIKQCGNADKGTALGAIINLEKGETILNIFTMNIDEKRPYIAGFTKSGMVKKSNKLIYVGSTQNKKGMKAAGLKENDTYITFEETNGDYAVITTSDNRALQIAMDDVRESGKTARGKIAIKLNDGAYVTQVSIGRENKKLPVRNCGTKGVQL